MSDNLQAFNYGIIASVIPQLGKGVELPGTAAANWIHRHDSLPNEFNKGNHAVVALNDANDTFITINNAGIVSISQGGIEWNDIPTGKPGLYHSLITDGDIVMAFRAWAGDNEVNPEAPVNADNKYLAGHFYERIPGINWHYLVNNWSDGVNEADILTSNCLSDPAFARASAVVGGVSFEKVRDAVAYEYKTTTGITNYLFWDPAKTGSITLKMIDNIKYEFAPDGTLLEGPIGTFSARRKGEYLEMYAIVPGETEYYLGRTKYSDIPLNNPRRFWFLSSGRHYQTFLEVDDETWIADSELTLDETGILPTLEIIDTVPGGVASLSSEKWNVTADAVYTPLWLDVDGNFDKEPRLWNFWDDDSQQAVTVQPIQLLYPMGLKLSKTGQVISEITAPFAHADTFTACAYGNGIWAVIAGNSPRPMNTFGYSVIISRDDGGTWEAIHIPALGPHEDYLSQGSDINDRGSLVFNEQSQKFVIFMNDLVVETANFDAYGVSSSNVTNVLNQSFYRVYCGGGKYLAWGMSEASAGTGSGTCAKSDDGKTWHPIEELNQSSILPEAAGYQNGEWLIMGQYSALPSGNYTSGFAISKDGMKTWVVNEASKEPFEPSEHDLAGWWRGVARGKARWVAVKPNTAGDVTSIASYEG